MKPVHQPLLVVQIPMAMVSQTGSMLLRMRLLLMLAQTLPELLNMTDV
jgi:hypothetical protein